MDGEVAEDKVEYDTECEIWGGGGHWTWRIEISVVTNAWSRLEIQTPLADVQIYYYPDH